MRVLVCGGREYDDWQHLAETLYPLLTAHGVLIQGGAKGADFLARVFAKWRGVPVKEYRANWERHGKAAGGIRNQLMLDDAKPDLVVAFPGGRGTADMVRRAERAGVPVQKAYLAQQREDDVEQLRRGLATFRFVRSVDPVVADPALAIAEARIRREMQEKFYAFYTSTFEREVFNGPTK